LGPGGAPKASQDESPRRAEKAEPDAQTGTLSSRGQADGTTMERRAPEPDPRANAPAEATDGPTRPGGWKYPKGEAVLYRKKLPDGSFCEVEAVVVAVDNTLSPPAYTIALNGSTRETEASRLLPMPSAGAAQEKHRPPAEEQAGQGASAGEVDGQPAEAAAAAKPQPTTESLHSGSEAAAADTAAKVGAPPPAEASAGRGEDDAGRPRGPEAKPSDGAPERGRRSRVSPPRRRRSPKESPPRRRSKDRGSKRQRSPSPARGRRCADDGKRRDTQRGRRSLSSSSRSSSLPRKARQEEGQPRRSASMERQKNGSRRSGSDERRGQRSQRSRSRDRREKQPRRSASRERKESRSRESPARERRVERSSRRSSSRERKGRRTRDSPGRDRREDRSARRSGSRERKERRSRRSASRERRGDRPRRSASRDRRGERSRRSASRERKRTDDRGRSPRSPSPGKRRDRRSRRSASRERRTARKAHEAKDGDRSRRRSRS